MNQQAVQAYACATRKVAARNDLVEEYLPLVRHVLGRLALHLPGACEMEDLMAVGVMGLIEAANTYDPGRGASFKTHAYVHVRGAILDEVRRLDPVPRSRRDRLRLVSRVEGELAEKLQRPPSCEEIAEAAELTVRQVEEVFVHAHGAGVVSLDERSSGKEGEGSSLMERLRAPGSEDPSAPVEREEFKTALAKAIEGLPERERHVIVLYYGEGLLLKEIGAVMGVSESRVCQLHARALHQLNHKLGGHEPAE